MNTPGAINAGGDLSPEMIEGLAQALSQAIVKSIRRGGANSLAEIASKRTKVA